LCDKKQDVSLDPTGSILDNTGFENGWNGWNDGGDDTCLSILDSSCCKTGNYCVCLCGDSISSVMTKTFLVDFSYFSRNK